jgi:hypothetical protein
MAGKGKFGRRGYTVKDDNGRPIEQLGAEVTIKIGGKIHTQVSLRTPGMIALIVKPEAPDRFEIEMVEDGGKRYTDVRLPPEAGDPLPWQLHALGTEKL